MRYPSLLLLMLCFSSLLSSQTDRQIQNIETFSKLYGYVKYFHPSDEAAEIFWNEFAVYGVQEVENCPNQEELRKTLLELFHPIAPTLQISPTGKVPSFDLSQLEPADKSQYQTITWQHKGIYLGNSRNIYNSIRLNRGRPQNIPPDAFGSFNTSINAEELAGKSFRYSADVRRTAGFGTGQLWIRNDRKGGGTGSYINMQDRPIKLDAWTNYTIEGTIDEDVGKIVFGGFLRGEGQLELDNLKLEIKNGSDWEQVYSHDFEKDNTGRLPNYFSSNIGQGNSKGELYNFRIEKVDRQKVLVLSSKTKEELPKQELKSLFEHHNQVGDIWEANIGSGLSCQMPLALYGNSDHTYPTANPQAVEKLNQNILALFEKDLVIENRAFRLADIVILWNIFQHFYPYFDVVETDWAAEQRVALKQAYSDQTEQDFLLTLRKITATLKDGHIRVNSGVERGHYFRPAVDLTLVDDQIVIDKVYEDGLGLAPGDIVVSLDGQAAKEVIEKEYAQISAATNGWKKYRFTSELLRGPKDSELSLTIKDDQRNTREVRLQRNYSSSRLRAKKEDTQPIRVLEDDIFYVNIDKAEMNDIKAKLDEISQSKGLICDLRGYPNRNHDLIRYLLPQPDTSSRWMRIPQVIYPDQKNLTHFEEIGWQMQPAEPHIGVPIVFIIDGRAISYAESYMGFIEHYNLATIVGEATAGTNGNINPFALPGGFRITWTGMLVKKHDDRQHHGVGIEPDIPVKRTIAGIRAGKDEFLDKAIDVIKSKQKR